MSAAEWRESISELRAITDSLAEAAERRDGKLGERISNLIDHVAHTESDFRQRLSSLEQELERLKRS